MGNPNGVPATTRRTGRMGLMQYARVLSLVTGTARTHAQIAAMMGRGKQSMREILWRMEHLGLVHVVEWREPASKRSLKAAAFLAGEGESAPYPNALKRTTPGADLARNNPRPELISFAHIVRALRDGCTRAELHHQTGVLHHNIAPLLRAMRELGMIHTCGWVVRDDLCGRPAEVIKMGRRANVPRPLPQTSSEKAAKYRLRRKQRTATLRVVQAIQGKAEIVKHGQQAYHLLGGEAA